MYINFHLQSTVKEKEKRSLKLCALIQQSQSALFFSFTLVCLVIHATNFLFEFILFIFFFYIGQVMLKMKSRHVAGTVTKKKKSKSHCCFNPSFASSWHQNWRWGLCSWNSFYLGIRESSVYAMQFYSNCFEFSDVVLEVMRNIPAWPGRHLLEGGEHRRYFALKTVARGVVEFECRNQREYDVWTQGVSRLLIIAAEKNNKHRIW